MLLHHLLRCLSLHLTQIHLHRHHLVWTSEPATSSSACGHGMAQKEDQHWAGTRMAVVTRQCHRRAAGREVDPTPKLPSQVLVSPRPSPMQCRISSVRFLDRQRQGRWLKHIQTQARDGALLAAGCCREHLETYSAGHGHCAAIQASPLCSALLLLAWARVSASSSVEKPLQLVSLPGHTRLLESPDLLPGFEPPLLLHQRVG